MKKYSKYNQAHTAALDDLVDPEDRTWTICEDSFGQTVHHLAYGMTEAFADRIIRLLEADDED